MVTRRRLTRLLNRTAAPPVSSSNVMRLIELRQRLRATTEDEAGLAGHAVGKLVYRQTGL